MTDLNSIWELRSNEDDDVNEPIVYNDDEFDDVWNGVYHDSFPEEWAVNHEDGTGPEQCVNCAVYGCVGDTFIGYCANCAIGVYKGSRGRGFMDALEEYDATKEGLDYPSAFETYLKGVVFITDEDMCEPADIMGEPYETSILNCHFEGGYNDF
jgi:hypothetical protein